MKISLLLLLSFFLSSCAHQKKSQLPSSPHPCFVAVAKDDLDYLKKNLQTCTTIKTQSGTTPLMLAAAKGRDQIIQFLLENGVDINEPDLDFSTAINYAVITNQVATAGLLILSGADLETKRADGITVLMNAVQLSSPQMVRVLVTTRQSINSKAQDGWTALYFSIRRQDHGILALLLRQGACKNTIDLYNQTPLDFAMEVGWKEGISLLKTAPACGFKSVQGQTPSI